MNTGSLLARLRKLQQCEESFEQSDKAGMGSPPDPAQTGQIEFKNTSEWVTAYHDLKEILNNREHLPSAAEREEKRKKRSR